MKKNIPGKCHRNKLGSFTGKNLTRFGGAGLIRQFFDKLGVSNSMTVLGTYKRRKDDCYPADMCISMLYGLMMGIFRPSHMMELAADKVFQKIVRLSKFPSQSTISRFLAKITVHKADHVGGITAKSGHPKQLAIPYGRLLLKGEKKQKSQWLHNKELHLTAITLRPSALLHSGR